MVISSGGGGSGGGSGGSSSGSGGSEYVFVRNSGVCINYDRVRWYISPYELFTCSHLVR